MYDKIMMFLCHQYNVIVRRVSESNKVFPLGYNNAVAGENFTSLNIIYLIGILSWSGCNIFQEHVKTETMLESDLLGIPLKHI